MLDLIKEILNISQSKYKIRVSNQTREIDITARLSRKQERINRRINKRLANKIN